jgi:hypothetical protein
MRPARRAPSQARARRQAILFLSLSAWLPLVHAFVPIRQFIHRSDDAYYYFKVAVNYPALGFWSFDRIHSTNGVQPLWAFILTVIAQLLSSLGITDPDATARVFVGCTALVHVVCALMLFHLLSRAVSTLAGVVAAGAFLFPLGIVWRHVAGLENSLYALLIVSTVGYVELTFVPRPTLLRAAVVGILLGLTTLARLNAGIFIPLVLLRLLFAPSGYPVRWRVHRAALAGVVASIVVIPYFLANYATTGHLLPISGAVKRVLAAQFLEVKPVREMIYGIYHAVGAFVRARAGDGLWLVGSKVIVAEDRSLTLLYLALLGVVVIGLPLLAGPPRRWIAYLRGTLGRLRPFWYVLAFGLLDAVVCVLWYPNQVRNAMTSWWWANDEIIIIVVVAATVAASVTYLARAWVPAHLRVPLLGAVLLGHLVFHAQQTVRFFWSPMIVHTDWKTSWNDELYDASRWLSDNLPADTIVGAWNAGILGFYARQRVVNLDGLINNFELLPYLRDRRMGEYVRREHIAYLSDIDWEFPRYGVDRQMRLTQVYSRYSKLMNRSYVIYRVDSDLLRLRDDRAPTAGALPGG